MNDGYSHAYVSGIYMLRVSNTAARADNLYHYHHITETKFTGDYTVQVDVRQGRGSKSDGDLGLIVRSVEAPPMG